MLVLVTGGTGYAGQFIVQSLAQRGFEVSYTYTNPSQPSSLAIDGRTCPGFQVNFANGDGLSALFATHPPFDVVINTAAWSQPVACEKDEAGAHKVNVPSELVARLEKQTPAPLLIHISTDHVYEGLRPMWDETDPLEPVNAYGRSKVAADNYVLANYPRKSIILRPSMIIGPAPPLLPVNRGLFLQWLEGQLTKGERTNLFTNEYRTPTAIFDLVAAVNRVLDRASEGEDEGGRWVEELPQEDRVLNIAVPERLSRYEMGLEIARLRGLDAALANPITRPEGVPTPLDISMRTARAERVLGIQMTAFATALARILG